HVVRAVLDDHDRRHAEAPFESGLLRKRFGATTIVPPAPTPAAGPEPGSMQSMKVGGTVRVPGDKSITHRLLLLAAMARGTSHIGGALTSLDARATARCLRQLGAGVSPLRSGTVTRVDGLGRLRAPDRRLDCGNAGTTARLLLGLLAAHRFETRLTGDASLRRRPMRRVTEPLGVMGARFAPAG